MFTNEAVPTNDLDPAFARYARQHTVDALNALLIGYGPDWSTAVDEFYLGQRMHRWAGVLASADCLDRTVVNPMLDGRFLNIARRLRPAHKRNSLFLSKLSCSLDEEISRIPMDSRPSPSVYAHPTTRNRALLSVLTARRMAGKVHQRLVGRRKPPLGSDVLAAKIGQYYASNPGLLESLATHDVFDRHFLEQVAAGSLTPGPASAALLVNLEVATTHRPAMTAAVSTS